jgi:hypothetical protein
LLGKPATVRVTRGVTSNLPADGAGCAFEYPGNCPDTQTLLKPYGNGLAFLVIKLFVVRFWFHAHTLLGLDSGVLHFTFERAGLKTLI